MTALATADLTANAPVPFAFESHQIRTDTIDGQPWFVARDVCAALSMDWSGKSLRFIPATWTRMGKFPIRRKDGSARPVRISLINEPAVYKLAFRSNKPEADRFTNWVASEVIPALRRQEKYELCPTPEAPRLTTAKERNALTGLVNRYVGLLPGGPNQEAYKAAWRKVHDVMGIGAIEELTVEQLPRAVVFVQSMVDFADSMLSSIRQSKALHVGFDPQKPLYREGRDIDPNAPDVIRAIQDGLRERFHVFQDALLVSADAVEKAILGGPHRVMNLTDRSISRFIRALRHAQEQAWMGWHMTDEILEGLIDLSRHMV